MITLAPAPPEILAAVDAGLRGLAGDGERALVTETLVSRTPGIPVVALEAIQGDGPRALPTDRWRFLLFDGRGPLWADVEDGRISGLLRGAAVETLLRACGAAECLGVDGSAAILTMSEISAEALWISGGTDRFWPLSPEAVEQVGWTELSARWDRAAGALGPGQGEEEIAGGEEP